MSQDDVLRVAIAHVALVGDDPEGVRDAITDAIRNAVADCNGHLVVRMHPTAWKRFKERVSAAVYPLPKEAQEAVYYRCNLDQEPSLLSISVSEVRGDSPCY